MRLSEILLATNACGINRYRHYVIGHLQKVNKLFLDLNIYFLTSVVTATMKLNSRGLWYLRKIYLRKINLALIQDYLWSYLTKPSWRTCMAIVDITGTSLRTNTVDATPSVDCSTLACITSTAYNDLHNMIIRAVLEKTVNMTIEK
jgi:hypothetical protein